VKRSALGDLPTDRSLYSIARHTKARSQEKNSVRGGVTWTLTEGTCFLKDDRVHKGGRGAVEKSLRAKGLLRALACSSWGPSNETEGGR